MKNSFKKLLFALVMVCFILTASNVMLALHLSEHHKDENHDHQHCPICQQVVINKNLAVLPPPVGIYTVNEIPFTITYANSFFPQIVRHRFPSPRAPPVTS
ncbi:MAG: hypothetical protein PHY02_10420 [Phycisphaerae bacterium]|nr:hypothetical protein [Phycisphaerae bacterium]